MSAVPLHVLVTLHLSGFMYKLQADFTSFLFQYRREMLHILGRLFLLEESAQNKGRSTPETHNYVSIDNHFFFTVLSTCFISMIFFSFLWSEFVVWLDRRGRASWLSVPFSLLPQCDAVDITWCRCHRKLHVSASRRSAVSSLFNMFVSAIISVVYYMETFHCVTDGDHVR